MVVHTETDFKVVIPARYASTRLPGKPLLDIGGKPMVIHVVEQALLSGASEVIVATDHAEILATVTAHGYQAIMTRQDHASGTDRIAEVASLKNWPEHTIVVNVQGDEPLIAPSLIREVAQNLAQHPEAAMSTACHEVHETLVIMNPNVVKVVLDAKGYALYFSRAPIPYARDAFSTGDNFPADIPVYRHIGIYAYKTEFLSAYASLAPADIERCEALEQLRALWHGYRISACITDTAPATGVDTEQDLVAVRALLGRAAKVNAG